MIYPNIFLSSLKSSSTSASQHKWVHHHHQLTSPPQASSHSSPTLPLQASPPSNRPRHRKRAHHHQLPTSPLQSRPPNFAAPNIAAPSTAIRLAPHCSPLEQCHSQPRPTHHFHDGEEVRWTQSWVAIVVGNGTPIHRSVFWRQMGKERWGGREREKYLGCIIYIGGCMINLSTCPIFSWHNTYLHGADFF